VKGRLHHNDSFVFSTDESGDSFYANVDFILAPTARFAPSSPLTPSHSMRGTRQFPDSAPFLTRKFPDSADFLTRKFPDSAHFLTRQLPDSSPFCDSAAIRESESLPTSLDFTPGPNFAESHALAGWVVPVAVIVPVCVAIALALLGIILRHGPGSGAGNGAVEGLIDGSNGQTDPSPVTNEYVTSVNPMATDEFSDDLVDELFDD
jgi:hypothetical protein